MYDVSYPWQRDALMKEVISARFVGAIGGAVGSVGNVVGNAGGAIGGTVGGVVGGIGGTIECVVNPRACIERKIREFLSTYGPIIALLSICAVAIKMKR